MRVSCSTHFDITATGVKSYCNISRMPFRDDAGNMVETATQWHRARNQQRNWETINQVLALRVLPSNITPPRRDNNAWTFEFEVEQPAGLESLNDPLGALKSDCRDVPMITGLDESTHTGGVLAVGSNLFFDVVDDK